MANKKDDKTIIWKKSTNVEHDLRYEKIQEFKAQIVKIEFDNLARKTSRAHEVYRKTTKKPQLDKKKIIDKNNPMYKILLNAQKKNNQLRKQAFKTDDPNYIDVNNMTVADRVKVVKLAKKNSPYYRQLLLEKNTTGLSELARKRKIEMMRQGTQPKKRVKK
ncbi:hypothetical protein S100390_v1c02030 [Spiroplasma sp. NBRC 100390]|uniref:hypothetical protein n=1 Tax=unclassified Spiroplasma TaxID=2637901 RepID=UPI000892A064|nr:MULTISPECIES: hypothetical protein [unclassified Spiroplasma]AOX43546.1 hypothetical protein STU14_v1c02030 [Spiroplasma sp. TU-14]APE13016.1 hypothetical protein S100390_v1c02030 [Spiroplasma sp. NBRC 100390]